MSNRLTRQLPLLLSLCICAFHTAAQETEEPHCRLAQQIVATTAVEAQVVSHTDYEVFVDSKATTSPLTVQQYLSTPLPTEPAMPTVLSCKMKTAERINAAGQLEEGAPDIARGDSSCQAVHREWLAQLRSSIPALQQAVAIDTLVVDEEELTFMGPMWLRPWPFQPLYRDDEGLLHIRSKALYVPFAWWIPMPDRFKGTYYCHFIAPEYLRAIVRGDAKPPV